jgi:hypothetical protein
VIVNISTLAGGRGSWPLTSAERLQMGFAPDAKLTAGRQVYDQLWDGPVPQPTDPRDWDATTTADATPKLAAATAALRDALTGLDLTRVPRAESSSHEYANVHLTYAQRPVGVDGLHVYQERDGSWTVPMHTSLNDLFVDPVLAPVVDAARAVLAAAR